jgi:cytochrome c-type biogenesis protein CcmE
MKPKHQRLVFVCVSVVFLCVSALLVMRAFRDNLVFFYSPSELAAKPSDPARMIRIGGLVSLHSLVHDSEDRIHFELTDGKT